MLPATKVGAASYNSATGELFLPSLINASSTLIDVVIKLNPNGTYIIQSGTESTLPFQCPGVFSEATLNLVKLATSTNEIDSLLSCRWNFQTKISLDAIGTFPASTGSSTVWLDSTCSSLVVSINDFSGGPTVQSSSITQNNGGCNTNMGFNNAYNLNSKVFLIKSVVIDNSTIATDVVIRFTNGNHYELINIVLTPRLTPPVICPTITDAGFNTISTSMTPDEVNSVFNCQWQHKVISGKSTSSSMSKNYSWIDHECNEIVMTDGGQSITFSQNKTAGCGSFGAR